MLANIPLTHILSKTFLRPEEMPECLLAREELTEPRPWVFLDGTMYFGMRVGWTNWNSPGCGSVPRGLDKPLQYWVTPWADKPRERPQLPERAWRILRFPFLYVRFRRIIRAISASPSGWIGPPAYGILLIDVAGNEVCILLDGHHRVGALAALGRMDTKVPVEGRFFDLKGTLRAGEGKFSEGDCLRIWRHCFSRVYDA